MIAACGERLPHSTLDGAYSVEQAQRGKDIYAGMCVSCHAGMGNHVGPVFRARWGGYLLSDLFQFVSDSMPKNNPGALEPAEYAAVIAYLLQLNGFPAGKSPLPTDPKLLEGIRFDTVLTTK